MSAAPWFVEEDAKSIEIVHGPRGYRGQPKLPNGYSWADKLARMAVNDKTMKYFHAEREIDVSHMQSVEDTRPSYSVTPTMRYILTEC
jgi:hypothetical protein